MKISTLDDLLQSIGHMGEWLLEKSILPSKMNLQILQRQQKIQKFHLLQQNIKKTLILEEILLTMVHVHDHQWIAKSTRLLPMAMVASDLSIQICTGMEASLVEVLTRLLKDVAEESILVM